MNESPTVSPFAWSDPQGLWITLWTSYNAVICTLARPLPRRTPHRLLHSRVVPGLRRRPLILLAHADPAVRDRCRQPLEAAGVEVVDVAGVAAAIEHAVATVPDLVLLGADDDGIEPARAVAALQADEHLLDIPVVLVTTDPDRLAVIEALGAGAHDVLRLPAPGPEIVSRVEAGLALRRVQVELRQRVKDLAAMARLDQLTGLATRRHLEEHVRMLASSARRQGRRLSVVLFDVDHLRRVNTDLTREAGDAVLREVGRRITSALRTDDAAGRWGGEEFLVVLPATELAGAWTLADRIRRSVAEAPISVPGGEALVTVSGGCADGDGSDMEDQIRRAEASLDAAKDAGRNRVMTDPTSAA